MYFGSRVCVHVRVCVCGHVCVSTFVRLYVCTYTRACVGVSAHEHLYAEGLTGLPHVIFEKTFHVCIEDRIETFSLEKKIVQGVLDKENGEN